MKYIKNKKGNGKLKFSNHIFPKGKIGFGGDGFGIVLILIALAFVGFAVPLIASAIGSDVTTANIEGVRSEVQDSSDNISILGAGRVLLEIFTFALFGWGDALGVPSGLAFIFTMLAITLLVLGFRTIRGVG